MRTGAIFALCACQHAAVPRKDRLRLFLGIEDPVEHYSGNFYGVEAQVQLNMKTRIAEVLLKGVVLGGSVSGRGWLKDSGAEEGAVVLDRHFEARLRRRFVRIRGAALDRAKRVVVVRVSIPVLGDVELVLNEK